MKQTNKIIKELTALSSDIRNLRESESQKTQLINNNRGRITQLKKQLSVAFKEQANLFHLKKQ
jgi:hypothetical protein